MYHKKNSISYANAKAKCVGEELCGIWIQKYFIYLQKHSINA